MFSHGFLLSAEGYFPNALLSVLFCPYEIFLMGISLLDCADPDPAVCARKIYDKICRRAEQLVPVGCAVERELGIPIVNKRISVTPIAIVAAACQTEDFVPFARAMDAAAEVCGVDFIGGFSALVQKGMKGAMAAEEAGEAENAIRVLGGSLERICEYPVADAVHRAVIVKKVRATPAPYPRAFAKIKKNPL